MRLSPVIESAMEFADPYIPPESISGLQLAARWKRHMSRVTDYMWSNRIKRALADTERVKQGYKVRRAGEPARASERERVCVCVGVRT